jgi:hypothetical protein
VAEGSGNGRDAKRGEAHGESADEAGDGEGFVGAGELSFGDARNLYVDLNGRGAVEILLNGLRFVGLGELLYRAHGLSAWMHDRCDAC